MEEFETYLIIGIILVAIIGTSYLYFDHSRRKKSINKPVYTKGKIVEIELLDKKNSGGFLSGIISNEDGSSPKVLQYPVVRFAIDGEGGKGVKFRDLKGFEEIPFKIGDMVDVVYDKDNPLISEVNYDN